MALRGCPNSRITTFFATRAISAIPFAGSATYRLPCCSPRRYRSNVHRDFAFIQTAPDRVFIGWGPFEQSPMRKPGRPAFYIADFFLDDPHPWRHPSKWEELTFDALIERFGDAPAP